MLVNDQPRSAFRSVTEAPARLLARVRERLKREGPPPEMEGADPAFDLAEGQGLLEGWYEPETLGDSQIRWTARRFGFEARVEEATHILLEACLFEESGFRELRARIRADDVTGAPVRLRVGWNRVFFPIPAGVAGRKHFSIDTGGSWCPTTAGASTDERELSVAVRRLEFVRLPDLPRAPRDPFVPTDFRARPPKSGALFAAVRKIRRLLPGWEIELRLAAHEAALARLERRLLDDEGRFNNAADSLEEKLESLVRADAEAREDLAASEAEWRADLARRLRRRDSP